MQSKKRALGRGLEALLPPKPKPVVESVKEAAPQLVSTGEMQAVGGMTLPVSSIRRNEAQPRLYFDEDALRALSDSIKRHGIIQPIAVMKRTDDYVIVAGERRFRAAQLAGLTEVPVILMEPLTDKEVLEFALVENLQRENLNAMEEARAFKALQDTFDMTPEEIAEAVGRSRPSVSNTLRLLQLPVEMQEDIETDRISAGHARALLMITVPAMRKVLRNQILHECLSVRQAEGRARELLEIRETRQQKPRNSKSSITPPQDQSNKPDMQLLRERLTDALACKVNVFSMDGKQGKIEIHFETMEDLDPLLNSLEISF